jgi:hypothetical protein
MRSPFGWQSGCLSSMGGPAGTHLSSLINGAYSRLSRGRGGQKAVGSTSQQLAVSFAFDVGCSMFDVQFQLFPFSLFP